MTTEHSSYTKQLNDKVKRIHELFEGVKLPAISIYESPEQHYRMRTEFKIWHEGHQAYYAMHKPGIKGKPYIIDEFPIAGIAITALMPKLLKLVNQNELLKKKLFQMEFLSTLSGEMLVTLIYHKALSDEWLEEASLLSKSLNIFLVGRSRKQKLIIGQDYVTETLTVNNKTFHYQQIESSFTQPNARICEKMLAWAVKQCTNNKSQQEGDLLELYCGNGNFTLPLSKHFTKVLATEIAKSSVASALHNCQINNITNITFLRMSSEEFSDAISKVREFRRLKEIDLDSYNFSTVLVDPPRAGVDQHTLEIIKSIDTIIYISCNPETLKENINELLKTHQVTQIAIFDQFPFTHHIESGVVLKKL